MPKKNMGLKRKNRSMYMGGGVFKPNAPVSSSFRGGGATEVGTEKKVQSYKSEISEEEAESYRLKNNNLFKEVIRFSNVYNRCIGFDGSQWHSANDFSNIDKEEERLTLIMFWEAIVGQPTGLHRTKMSAI